MILRTSAGCLQVAHAYNVEVNVTDVMLPWIEQKGYPVVTVAMSTDRASVAVTQKMFLINPLNGMSEAYPSQYKYVHVLRSLRLKTAQNE